MSAAGPDVGCPARPAGRGWTACPEAASPDHFTTPAGSEWGWRADGTFVNNLPGLQAVPILGSPTNSTRSIPILLPVAGGIPAIDIHMRDTNANVFHVDDTLPPGSTRPRSYRLHVVP